MKNNWLILCGLTLLAAGPVWATFPGENGKIAFSTTRDGNDEIYVMNPDGTEQTRLTDNQVSDLAPAFSPDGEKIAFMSDRDGDFQIYVMNADGSGVTRLTNNANQDSDPTWSPDGQQIVFVSDRDGNLEIYVMNADGSEQTNLTNHPAADYYPDWSPEGSLIAFTTSRDVTNDIRNTEVYVMNADGSSPTNLSNDPTMDDALPSWSPDGQQIAFRSRNFTLVPDNDPFSIYVMNADGTGQTRLTTQEQGFSQSPAWSPNGQNIAFARGFEQVFVMNADGSGQTPLTSSGIFSGAPNWSPAITETTSPDTAIFAAPPSLTNSTSASFSFISSETGSTFICSLDGKAFSACTSPQVYSKLKIGSHTFQVRATDAAGNTDPTPASHAWTIDTKEPKATILTGPKGKIAVNSATFTWSGSDDATPTGSLLYSYRLDSIEQNFSPFGSATTASYNNLPNGSYTFYVKARDQAGNESKPDKRAFTVKAQ